MRNTAIFIIGLVTSAVFLWLAVRNVALETVSAALARAELVWAIPLLLALAGFCVTKAWRWAILLGIPTRIGLMPLTHAVLAGYAATSLLPLQLGELVRAWGATRSTGVRMAPVLVSIAVERVLDLFAVFLVLGAALLWGGSLPDGLLKAGYVFAAGALVLLVALVGYVAYTDALLRVTGRLTAFLPVSWGERIQHHLRHGATGAQSLRQPRVWTVLAVSSIVQWALMAGCIAASCAALGLDVPIAAAVAVLGLTIIGMSLPSGPGYVGSIQLAFTLGLAPFAVDAADAVAASLFYHVLVCGSLIVVGLVSLYHLGGSLATLRATRTVGADNT